MFFKKKFPKTWKFLGCFASGLAGYYTYIYLINNQLEIICQNTLQNKNILKSVKELNKVYLPSCLLPFRFMEIIYGNTLDSRHKIEYQREILKAPDGETLALDWNHSENLEESSPIVVFFPGLSGSSASPYIRKGLDELQKKGFRSVVFNPRGAVIPQKTQNLFGFKLVYEDLDFLLTHVESCYPKSNIYFVGFSLGASYGMRFLSQNQNQKRVKGMVCIGNPFDVFKAGQSLNSYKNAIYS